MLDSVDPDSVNPVTARAVAQAVAGASGEVPIIGDNDNGKVLKAVVSGGQKSAEWGEAAPAVTVDQHYSASSANAQSGTAVAEAIASVPSSSYTAGDGIKISNNKIAVRAGKNLDFANALVANQFYSPLREYYGMYGWSFLGQLNEDRLIQLRRHQGMTIKMRADATIEMGGADGGAHFAICRKNSDNTPDLSGNVVLVADAALTTDTSRNFVLEAGETYVADFSSLSEKSVGSFYDIGADADQYYLTVISYAAYTTVNYARFITGVSLVGSEDINTSEYYTENPNIKELVAVDQLPASTSADENKVLTVNSSGNPAWATPAGGGSAITYLNGTESAKDIMDMLDAGAFPVYKETVATATNDTRYLYYTVTSTRAYVDDQSMPAYSLTLTCLYPQREPNLSDNNYYGRIDAYNVRGTTWTKLNRQTL